jgi:hypothetical protein
MGIASSFRSARRIIRHLRSLDPHRPGAPNLFSALIFSAMLLAGLHRRNGYNLDRIDVASKIVFQTGDFYKHIFINWRV